MPKRVRKIPEFGRWVKQARIKSGQSQKELAESADLSQQYWSKIELQGFVPSDDELARICKALGRSEREAQIVLAEINKADKHGRVLEEEFNKFREWLMSRPRPLHIFVVRDNPEPINVISVKMHSEILYEEGELYLSILFRHSAHAVWGSFQSLAREIDKMWPKIAKDRPKEEPRQRISGYYRNPIIEEGNEAIPMAVPVILVMDPKGSHLYCYESHPDVYQSHRLSGEEEYLARFKSIMLLPTPSESAERFASWIGGTYSGRDLPSDRWTQIPWPEEIAGLNPSS